MPIGQKKNIFLKFINKSFILLLLFQFKYSISENNNGKPKYISLNFSPNQLPSANLSKEENLKILYQSELKIEINLGTPYQKIYLLYFFNSTRIIGIPPPTDAPK